MSRTTPAETYLGELFDKSLHKLKAIRFPKKSGDVCRNRHRGNEESESAFCSIKDRLTRNQNAVLRVIKERGDKGATTDEIADHFGVGQNVVSGRVSELHIKLKRIEKIGTRNTRNNHPAAVWRAL